MIQPPANFLPAPARRDTRMRNVLIIVGLMSLAYGIQLVIDLARPKLDESDPAIGLFGNLYPAGPKVTVWLFSASLPIALLVALIGTAHVLATQDPRLRSRRTRVYQGIVATVLLLPFPVFPISIMIGNPVGLLICVPSTAFGLWIMHRMQRYRRMPYWLPLALFGWGVFFATGFGSSMNIWWLDYSVAYLGVDEGILQTMHDVYTGGFLSAGVFEELGKGAGVAIAYILFRHHFDGVVSGIILGASAGLGFNFSETIEYMGAQGGATAEFQYWGRQSLWLMAAHTAFSAVVGAGFGIARQLRDPGSRRLVIACGFFIAAAGHFANNIMTRFYGQVKQDWFAPSETVDILVLHPLLFLVMQGPFVLIYLLLLRRGLRDQAAGLSLELQAEAQTPFGAITHAEVPVLLRPAYRFLLKYKAFRLGGVAAYRRLGRLHAAQLDLGTQRWHRSRGEVDPWAADESTLRNRVLRLKHSPAAAPIPPRPNRESSVPA